MFKSKTRPIAIPQSEHARLAGYIAQFWGNAQVGSPIVEPKSFMLGVTHHDRGYGLLDTMPIGEVADDVWLLTQKRGISMTYSDLVADTVALMHIRRLLSHTEGDAVAAVLALADERINHNVNRCPYTRQDFEKSDTITRLCDSIAFDFCFEKSSQFAQGVYSATSDEMQSIQVTIEGSLIQLDPWPLNIPAIHGFIVGYTRAGYPDHLEPVLVEFTVTPAPSTKH